MNTKNLYISKPTQWAPSLETPEDWKLWSENQKNIENTNNSPAISFTAPNFRRRLSQLSKMTIQVVHDQLEQSDCKDAKQVFTSFNGELNRTVSILDQITEDNMILPASFSMSVYNTPIALATLACELKAGYSVIFPSKNDFKSSVLSAAAPVITGDEEKILFIYADEKLPDLLEFTNVKINPMAFTTVITSKPTEKSIPLDLTADYIKSPEALLKYMIKEF